MNPFFEKALNTNKRLSEINEEAFISGRELFIENMFSSLYSGEYNQDELKDDEIIIINKLKKSIKAIQDINFCAEITSDIFELIEIDKEESKEDVSIKANGLTNIFKKINKKINERSEKIETIEALNKLSKNSQGAGNFESENKNGEKIDINNHQIRKIINLAGFLKEAISGARKKKVAGEIGFHSVEQSNNLKRSLSSEIAQFGYAKSLAAYKFANSQLLSRRGVEKERSKKGPMILCVDNSGSMGSYIDVDVNGSSFVETRMTVANSFATAIVSICEEEEREIKVIFFNYNSREARFKSTIDFIQNCISGCGGGTNFFSASSLASTIKSSFISKERPTLFFLTDSQGTMPECGNEFEVFTIVIGEVCDNSVVENSNNVTMFSRIDDSLIGETVKAL
jgi:uncharacterized protein with von Willebrand factor type A (vWA) domain